MSKKGGFRGYNQESYVVKLPGLSSAAPLPKRGTKDSVPDGSDGQAQRLADARGMMCATMRGAKGHPARGMSLGVWRPERANCEVLVQRGKHFQTLGFRDPVDGVFVRLPARCRGCRAIWPQKCCPS